MHNPHQIKAQPSSLLLDSLRQLLHRLQTIDLGSCTVKRMVQPTTGRAGFSRAPASPTTDAAVWTPEPGGRPEPLFPSCRSPVPQKPETNDANQQARKASSGRRQASSSIRALAWCLSRPKACGPEVPTEQQAPAASLSIPLALAPQAPPPWHRPTPADCRLHSLGSIVSHPIRRH